MKIYTAEVFSEEKYQLGESPFYDSRTKMLSWVDIPAGTVHMLNDGTKKSCCLKKPVGAAVPGKKPRTYVVAASDGIYLLENGGDSRGEGDGNGSDKGDSFCSSHKISLIKNLSDYYEDFQRSNDAKADPKGRLWFGSSVDDNVHTPSGNLFCLENGTVTCRQSNTKISNGLAWSRDAKKFYFSDSLEHAVFVYDYDSATGNITNRKVLFTVENGVSDGMCIDSNDNLWVAFWDGRRIEQRSTKDGSLLATVNVDAQNVTSCCFMGNDLDTLFITTAATGQNGKYDGCLFYCKVDAKGLPCDYA